MSYIRTACRNAGVPDMWIEDAIQDVLFSQWLENSYGIMHTRRRAIDAARRYGWHTRYGTERTGDSLDDATALPYRDQYAVADLMMDAQRAWRSMTASARHHLLMAAFGRATVSEQRVHQLRERLRERLRHPALR